MIAHGPLTRASHETRDWISDVQEEEDPRQETFLGKTRTRKMVTSILSIILGSARPIVTLRDRSRDLNTGHLLVKSDHMT